MQAQAWRSAVSTFTRIAGSRGLISQSPQSYSCRFPHLWSAPMADVAILETRERVLAGILLTGAAYLLFSTQDASIKLLVAGMTVWQIMFFRSIAILSACAAIGGRQLFADTMRSPIVRPMLVRSAFTLAAWLCYYNAARS